MEYFNFLKNKINVVYHWWVERKDKKPIILIFIAILLLIYFFIGSDSVKTLISEEVDFNQEQIISYKNNVKVIIPSGISNDIKTVSIKTISDLPEKRLNETEIIASYDISIGDIHEFDKEIIIEIPYDSKDITEVDIEQGRIIASYFDVEKNSWISLPTKIDAEKKIIQFSTRHLSITLVEKLLWDVYKTDNFLILYDTNKIKKDSEINDSAWRVRGGGMYQGVVYDSDVPVYITDLGHNMEIALSKYKNTGFKSPVVAPPSEILQEVSRMVVKVDSYLADFTDSNYDKIYERIHISTGGSFMPHTLRLKTAHELFHAVQHQYFNIAQMAIPWRKWWLESTAEYAGWRLVWDGKNVETPPFLRKDEAAGITAGDYFSKKLETFDTKHEYASAYLIDYMVGRGGDFKTIWEHIARADWLDAGDVIYPLSEYLKTKGGVGLGEIYSDFVSFILFDKNSPIKSNKEDLKDKIPPELISDWLLIKDGDAVDRKIEIQADPSYTAKAFGIIYNSEKAYRKNIKIEITEDLPAYTKVFIQKLSGDKRIVSTQVANYVYKGQREAIDVELASGDGIYLLLVNTGSEKATAVFKLSESEFSINSIEPNPVIIGEKLIINGSGFGKQKSSDTIIKIGTVEVKEILSWSDNKIELVVPETLVQQSVIRDGVTRYDTLYIRNTLNNKDIAKYSLFIINNPLNVLKNLRCINISFAGHSTTNNNFLDRSEIKCGDLKVNGKSFSLSVMGKQYTREGLLEDYYFDGALSSDGLKLEKIMFKKVKKKSIKEVVETATVLVRDIPITKTAKTNLIYEIAGDDVKNLVSDFSYSSVWKWNTPPKITVTLYK